MDGLITVINDLQNIFKKTGTRSDAIHLPEIVVVGSQSCGKSSVLESLVGKSILPRGTGIVTRSPTVLQLVHVEDNGEEPKEWCSFPYSEDPDTKHDDFDEVCVIIEEMTITLAGNNKGISMEPITVRVCSPRVISLTVVDLPGVVKNPIGDQPEDIEEQVLGLIRKYVVNPNAIILAISPANADIATSESLKIAKDR